MSDKKCRVWCDGCFDLVHYGHANSLRQAKSMGDELIVGVHNDEEILQNKGPPVFTQEERYKMVRGIKWVDEVVEGSPYWPTCETLVQHDCDFAVHGDDVALTIDGRDPYLALKNSGKLRFFKRTEGVSTTDIVGRMLLCTRDHHWRSSELSTMQIGIASNHQKSIHDKTNLTRVSQFIATSNRIVQFSEGKDPRPGDKVVYVSGSFDLLHPGHLDFLAEARSRGDFLVVGVHSDSVVNSKLRKNYPIMNLHERTLSLLACRYVSEVVIGAEYGVTEALMKHFNVDLVCHGMTPVQVDARESDPYAVPKKLGKFQLIDTGNPLRTDMIVQRIIEHRLEFELRNAKKEAETFALV